MNDFLPVLYFLSKLKNRPFSKEDNFKNIIFKYIYKNISEESNKNTKSKAISLSKKL